MKKYNDFIKEYLFQVPSDIMYVCKPCMSVFDDGIEKRDESHRKLNLIGIILDWRFTGRYEARKSLSRSKYRRLCKRVERRFKRLERRYK